MINASPSIEQIVRNDLVAVIARAIDAAAMTGPGGNAPTGIVATIGVTEIDMSAAPRTWADILQFPASVQADDADLAAMGWALNAWTAACLRATPMDDRVAAAGFMMSAPNALAGYPAAITSALPGNGGSIPAAATLIFGSWSQLLVAYWSGFDLLINPFAGFRVPARPRPGPCVARRRRRGPARRELRVRRQSDPRRMIERRASTVELRAAGRRLEGHAATFLTEARIGDFIERIAPGAFSASLASGADILALVVDHDATRLLARTRSGSLRLSEDARGLHFEIDCPDTQLGRDVLALAERQDLGGASFAFSVPPGGDRWEGRRRELRAVDLREVSIVQAFPAYDGTTVQARSAAPRLRAARLWNSNTMKLPGFVGFLSRLIEQRDRDGSAARLVAEIGGTGWTASGTYISASGRKLGDCDRLVQAIASAIASLPAYVYRRTDAGRTEDTTHPLNRLIRQGANDKQSWPDFAEWLLASTLLRGNALAEILIDNRGAVVGLAPIPWGWVSVQRLPSGRIAYDIVAQDQMHGTSGRSRRLLQDEVLHLRDRSDDGVLGRSRLSRAAETIGASLATQNFASSLYKNGINPSGALSVEGRFTPESRETLRTNFREAFTGTQHAAKALILEQGVKWQQISVSPEDAELLASRRFSTEELARIFQVPPPLVGIWDHSSFTNSETAGRWFAQHTLSPWLRKIEAEFSRNVFGAGSNSYLELDLAGFLRGDPASRWASYDIAIKNRVLTPNEVRQVEGWNPRAGGDDFPMPATAAGAANTESYRAYAAPPAPPTPPASRPRQKLIRTHRARTAA